MEKQTPFEKGKSYFIRCVLDEARKDLEAKAETTNQIELHVHNLKDFSGILADKRLHEFGEQKWVRLSDVLRWLGDAGEQASSQEGSGES